MWNGSQSLRYLRIIFGLYSYPASWDLLPRAKSYSQWKATAACLTVCCQEAILFLYVFYFRDSASFFDTKTYMIWYFKRPLYTCKHVGIQLLTVMIYLFPHWILSLSKGTQAWWFSSNCISIEDSFLFVSISWMLEPLKIPCLVRFIMVPHPTWSSFAKWTQNLIILGVYFLDSFSNNAFSWNGDVSDGGKMLLNQTTFLTTPQLYCPPCTTDVDLVVSCLKNHSGMRTVWRWGGEMESWVLLVTVFQIGSWGIPAITRSCLLAASWDLFSKRH